MMATILQTVRQFWSTSLAEAVTLTAFGVVIVVVGLRVFRVMGPGELEVLQRTSIPGKHLLVRWLTR